MLAPSIRLYPLRLKQPWAIASRTGPSGKGISERCICLLRLEDEHGIVGYGEAAPVDTYGENPLTVLSFLRQYDWHRLSFDSLEESLSFLHSESTDRSARAAIDLALHDGASKARNLSIAKLLGLEKANHELPPTAYSIGIGDPACISAAANASARFPIIKLKAGSQNVEETLSAFRSVRPDAPLRIDGNEAWKTREQAIRQIEAAAQFAPIEFVEQPMPRDANIEDLIWLKKRSPIPLLADESCLGIDDLDRCCAGFHGVNIKLAKSGGIAPALSLIRTAKSCGLRVQIGCMIETSLGIAAALHLGQEADWLDLDGALLTQNDPFTGVVENTGQLSFGQGTDFLGIGVKPLGEIWQAQIPREKPISQRAQVPLPSATYGQSVNGIPLEVHLPSSGRCEILLFASIHGEEPETTALLSKALRSLDAPSPHCATVLCSNPDGTLLGTRCNARGVELNRNFPSANWRTDTVAMKWAPDHGRVDYSPGESPASEPETVGLISLVKSLSPKTIIALHAPLACIEDPGYSTLGYRLAKNANLPLVGDIGYETPGSFGSWAKENGYHVITYELPPISVSAMHGRHLESLIDVLRFGLSTPVLDCLST